MKSYWKPILLLFFMSLGLCWTDSNTAEASHYRGGNIYYENLGRLGGAGPQKNWYVIKATLIIVQRRSAHCNSPADGKPSCCAGTCIATPPRLLTVGGTFTWGAGQSAQVPASFTQYQPSSAGLSFTANPFEVIAESKQEDWLEFRYVNYRLYAPSVQTTTIKWGSCCWISGTKPSVSGFEINVVAQVASRNQDPQFNSPLLINACLGSPFTHNLNPSDPDRDDIEVIITATNGGADKQSPPLTVSKSGVITWPSPKAGLWVIKVTAYDLIKGTTTRKGASTFRDFLLDVKGTCANQNKPTIVCSTPDKVTVKPLQQACITCTATDPDNTKLTLRANPTKQGATFTPPTATTANQNSPLNFTYCWTPTLPDEGTTHNIQFTISDSGTPVLSEQKTFAVTVSKGGPPVIALSPTGTNKSVNEGGTLTFTAKASDTDTSIDTFTVTGLPSFCTSSVVSKTEIRITCKPGFADGDGAGGNKTYTVRFTAKDKDGKPKTTTTDVNIRVNNVNRAPSFISRPVTSVVAEQAYNYTVKATDPDTGDKLTYTKKRGPGSINPTTGQITWTPAIGDVGTTFDFEVEVCDNGTPKQCKTQKWKVTVQKPNSPPQIIGTPPTQLQSGQKLTYVPTVRDRDLPGDTHTWTLVSGPTGATVNKNTGELNWTSKTTDAGKDIAFSVRVCDKGGLCATQTWKVRIGKGNNPPQIVGVPSSTATSQKQYHYKPSVRDADQNDTHTWTLKGPTTASINPKTGEVFWTPDPSDVGKTVEFTATVCDKAGDCATQTWKVKVGESNTAPVIAGTPGATGTVGTPYKYGPKVVDPDKGDKHTWTLPKAPAGATINKTTGAIAWTPKSADDKKEHSFTAQVCDDKGSCATQTWKVRVGTGNTPPQINGQPLPTVDEDKTYTYTPKVVDPDTGDKHTWTGKLPKGATIDKNTGKVSWTPPAGSAGKSFPFEVTVCDDKGSCSTVKWTVKVNAKVPGTNNPPVISGTPGATGTVGTPYKYGPKVVDPDKGDKHTWTLPKAPAGATINKTTGAIEWTPKAADDKKEHSFTAQVCDDKGSCATQTWKVRVGTGNTPPQINGQPSTSGEESKAYTYSPTVVDPDTGDKHTWTGKLPKGATIDKNTGKVSWTPPAGSAGKSFPFEVTVCDDKGSCSTVKWTVKVKDNNVANVPPIITSSPFSTATQGKSYNYDITVRDPDVGDKHAYTLEKGAPGATLDKATGKLKWTPKAGDVGKSFEFKVKVCDKAGDCATQSWKVKVTKDNHPPQIVGAPGNFASPAKQYTFKPGVTDPDSEDQGKHKWKLKAGPTGTTVDPNNGELKWTPKTADIGKTFEFEVEVCDPSGACAQRKWKVLVTKGGINNAPVITSTPEGNANAGLEYYYKPTAVDPDKGDKLTWKLKSGPTTASIDPATGEIMWTPGASDVGKTASFEIEVCDDKGACTTQKWGVSVGKGNQAPTITSTPPTEAYVGEKMTYKAVGKDADKGDTLTWDLLNAPAGMKIDPNTGEVTWTPAPADAKKSHFVEVRVCDSAAPRACTTQRFNVKVFTRCRIDLECPTDEICVQGKCLDPGCSSKTPKCPGKEFCKDTACIPNGCDGKTCGAGETCRPSDGKCIKPCAGVTCKTGELCVDGTCTTDPCATAGANGGPCAQDEVCDTSNPNQAKCIKNPCKKGSCKHGRVCDNKGMCIDDPCTSMTCPSRDQRCVAGQCIDRKPCQVDVDCEGTMVCLKGRCYPSGCYEDDPKCAAPESCREGECKADPCASVKCDAGTFCRPSDGKCIKPCAGVTCKTGEKCVDGACVADPCDGVKCAASEVCVDGKCLAERCNASGVCRHKRTCNPATNTCMDDPCAGITCPDSKQVCENGQCVNPPQCEYDKDCPGEQLCVQGKCVVPSCKQQTDCNEAELCENGECKKNLCTGVKCKANEYCKAGKCVGSCAGVFCPKGEKCVDGSCTSDPCADKKCATGEVCVNGKCVKNNCEQDSCKQGRICSPEGRCIEEPCNGVKCPNGAQCNNGQCTGERPCKFDIECPGDSICEEGKCTPKGCYDGKTCANDELCLKGKCVKNGCDGKTCDKEETCRPIDAQCTKDCPTCKTGEVCVDGACKADPCDGITCQADEICVAGQCVSNKCKSDAGKPCKFQRLCLDGTCKDDPCAGVKCPDSQTCRLGVCYGKTVTPTEPKSEGGSKEASDEKTNTDGGTGNDGSSKEDPLISVGGGCGCSAQSQSPGTMVFFMLLFLGVLFSWKRRRNAL